MAERSTWVKRSTPYGGAYYLLRRDRQTLATVDYSRTTNWYWHGFGLSSLNGSGVTCWGDPIGAKRACRLWMEENESRIDEHGMADACRNTPNDVAIRVAHKALSLAVDQCGLAVLVDERVSDAFQRVREALRSIEKFTEDED